jgi:prepilin-type N-terminal cleavage/methylation domain-containing protein
MTKKLSRGYTLLELMVVLAIMGLIISITTPRLLKMYESMQFALERDDISFQLSLLSSRIYLQGKNMTLQDVLNNQSPDLLLLPNEWQVANLKDTKAIEYSKFGFCNGGELVLARNQRLVTLYLEAPLCTPRAAL